MKRQNTSSAVMQQRSEAADSLDDFPTPPWATRALMRFLIAQGFDLAGSSAWEPCCNRGYMVKPMREGFASVRASDVMRYPEWDLPDAPELIDFATVGKTEAAVDWIFANPPFRLAEEFIAVARDRARVGCAILVRSAFLEGQERCAMFLRDRPAYVLQFSERVGMFRARLVRVGELDPFNIDEDTGKPRKASSATAYCWIVFIPGHDGPTELHWIPPCRFDLEMPSDYPVYAMPAAPVKEAAELLL